MEKKTISAGIIGAGGFIGQEHLERLIHEIGIEIVCEKDTIRLPLPAEPIVRSRLKVRQTRLWTTGQSVSRRRMITSCSTGSTICAALSRPQVRATRTALQPAASRMQ